MPDNETPAPSPDSLLSDPILGPLLQANPGLLQEMMGGSATPAQPLSLAEALVGSAMTVTGRKGLTGSNFSGDIPSWASDLAPKILNHPDFDPYFGVVSEQGDERVFMGTRMAPVMATPPSVAQVEAGDRQQVLEDGGNAVATSGDGVEFRSGGAIEVTEEKRKPKKTGEKAPKDKTLTTMQALNLPYTWDEDEIAEAMKTMRQAGIPVTSFDMGTNSLVSVWGSLVDRAAMTYSMSEGSRKVTPWDVLDLYKSEAKAAGTYQNLDGNQTRTTVNRSVSDITEGEAWSLLQDQLSRMLGRDPSDQEVRDFTYRMNQLAAANPAISKTITKYKDGEAVSSSTKTSGGFTAADAQMGAYEDAQSDPEYAEYQSATTYFNAALSALGAIGA